MIHILVVEDDAKLNQLVCTYLSDCGFETHGCLNANDAYDEMYNSLYDLIISDIMMPGISKVNIHIFHTGRLLPGSHGSGSGFVFHMF